ncbi:hypothetical protein N9B68_01065 [bacterium]|nr:hypothetical protein [bacterium]
MKKQLAISNGWGFLMMEVSSLSFVNVWVDHLINPNVVVDFRIGWGLTEASEDLFARIGGPFHF